MISGLTMLSALTWCAAAVEAKQPSVLDQAGLGGLQQMSDEQGQTVRGQAYLTGTRGMSFVSGMLIDPATGSHVVGTNIQFSGAVTSGELWDTVPRVSSAQGSALSLSIIVESNNTVFSGSLTGLAGGIGFAGFPGFSGLSGLRFPN
jgi:hypothetical protein